MEVITECKADIVSNKGSALFKSGLRYKGHLRDGKARLYIIKDETGCLQSLQDDKFFKAHFKVVQEGTE